MTPEEFWRARIKLLLHDPPGKPFAKWYRGRAADGRSRSGHNALFAALLETLVDESNPTEGKYSTVADHAAAGADRPNLGDWRSCRVHDWRRDPVVTSPFSPGPALHAPSLDSADPGRFLRPKDSFDAQFEAVAKLREGLPDAVWADAEQLRYLHALLWRRFRDELTGRWSDEPDKRHLLWGRIPADTRVPDHSVWDHTRMAAALCFMDRDEHPERQPWMLSFEVGPVTAFIEQARTARDLWTGSFLLSDLAWHSMLPIVKRYGPDAVIYPDLRGNPRVDRWIADHPDALGSPGNAGPIVADHEAPGTRAAVIPNHWVALVPRGGNGQLQDLDSLGQACQEAVQKRWSRLATRVWEQLRDVLKDHFSTDVGIAAIEKLWHRQHENVLHSTWAAVPWERFTDMDQIARGGALPAQGEDAIDPLRAGLAEREARLRPWMDLNTWAAYEHAREVQANHFARYMQRGRGFEGGFDYPLVHHRLQVWHTLRKADRPWPADTAGAGERCTVCKHRQALGPTIAGHDVDSQRSELRYFWRKLGRTLGHPRWGSERLCGVCTFKRLLVQAGRPEHNPDDFNRTWACGLMADEARERPGGKPDLEDNKLRMPFPSTAAMASQVFLEAVVKEDRLASLRHDIVMAAQALDWPRNQFPDALPRLKAVKSFDGKFLMYDAHIVHPDAMASELRQSGKNPDPGGQVHSPEAARLVDRIRTLRRAATDAKIPPPQTRFALLALDGDRLGRLLLGVPEQVKNVWRNVLHPQAINQLLESDSPWKALLDRPRQVGPSLHAALSRALADFAHRMVRWVVEEEFGGRLIYSGGDDVLALAPADDALPIAARLQQLFSAPWVLDTQPGWQGDHNAQSSQGYKHDEALARKRFRIPAPEDDGRVRLPVSRVVPHSIDYDEKHNRRQSVDLSGELLPMPGPFQSVSAGIVYAHFKTPLQMVIHRARELLDNEAKEQGGRSAVAMAVMSRGGEKVKAVLPWYDKDRSDGDDVKTLLTPPMADDRIRRISRAFQEGHLPGRLPYKLADETRRLGELVTGEGPDAERMRKGVLGTCLETRRFDDDLLHDLFELWSAARNPARHPSAIRLCRELAGRGEDE